MNELQKFDKLKADIVVFVEPTKALKVIDKESSDLVLGTAKQIKDWQKKVEETRKSLVGPLNDQVKKINDYAKQIGEPLNDSEAHLKSELRAWEIKLQKEREEAARKAEAERRAAEEKARKEAEEARKEAEAVSAFLPNEEAKKQEIIVNTEAERKMSEIQDNHKSLEKEIASNKVSGSKKVWTFEITDQSMVPDIYWEINEKAIREAVRNGVREIPGVKIFQDIRISL